MAEKITIRPKSDFDKFFESLHSALPNDFHYLLQYRCDEFRQRFDSLSDSDRHRYITFLRDRPEYIRDRLLFFYCYWNVNGRRVDSIFSVLKGLLEMQSQEEKGKYPQSSTRAIFKAASSFSNDQLSDDFLQLKQNLLLLEASDGTPPGHYGAAYRNNGAAGTKFQNHQAGASHGTPSDHDTPSCNSNTAGTPYLSSSNKDVVLSMDGLLSGLQPSLAETLNKPVTNLSKEIHDFFQGNPELVRDDPTWFKTLLGINGGVIITLISNSMSNNPQSLLIEIMQSFAASCAVVGFSVSLAGLYRSTNKPKNLQFGYDPEVSTRNMGIVGGVATALGFTMGVFLLLLNNLFQLIATGLACAAILIPVLFKFLR